MAGEVKYGVTPPINTKLPTEEERRLSDALIEELRRQKTFESPSETAKRHKVLASLQEICDAFVKKAAAEPGKDPNDPEPNPAKRRDLPKQTDFVIKNARGKIFTYGSFRLGVFGPGSDIDTLIVAPKYVSRDRYFDLFPGLLLKMAPEGTITGLAVVTDAFVPIIKFEYSGISIDLIFSRVMQTQLPPDLDLRVNSLLRGLDDKELRSLNGTRVTDEILTLVPEQSTFKIALRAIKLWAQRRAIYANIMGFPGGVAWAMLVARVCQLYPKAAGSVIIHRFFKIIAQWRWPQPVLLKPIEDGPLPVPVWNPKVHRRDAMHLMPVITPAYPSMCSTYNITRSSMAIIQQELERAGEVAENIMSKQRPWSDLFVKHTFFTQDYRYYVSVVSASKTKEAGKQWSGRVESKVRMLVQKLEFSEEIELARPFNKSFERVHRCVDDDEVAAVQGGSPDHLLPMDAPPLPPPIKKPSDEDQAMKEEQASEENKAVKEEDANGENKVVKAEDASAENGTDATYPIDIYTSTHYIGIRLKPGTKQLDLHPQATEFKSICTTWDVYYKELAPFVSLHVVTVTGPKLPPDVFDEGEKRVAKGTKNAKKRGPSEDGGRQAKKTQSAQASV